MAERMRFDSATSRNPDPDQAAAQIASGIDPQRGGRPDLALAFLCGYAPDAAARLAAAVNTKLNAAICLGCTAESVIGRNEEIEEQTALSVVAASLPGVNLTAFA